MSSDEIRRWLKHHAEHLLAVRANWTPDQRKLITIEFNQMFNESNSSHSLWDMIDDVFDEIKGGKSEPRAQEDPRILLGFPFKSMPSLSAVKGRRRELSRLYHPDGGGGNEEAMKRLNAAYDALVAELPKDEP